MDAEKETEGKHMSKWQEIRNDFCDEEEGNVYIDAWETERSEEEGTVIAKIGYRTKTVEYLDDAAKDDPYAQEIIQDTLKNIDNGDYKDCM